MQLDELAARVVPIMVFLVAVTVIAELSSKIGVFAALARGAARLAHGSVRRLWLLIVVVAVLCTAVLSLDTTAVLLTPVVLALAAQLELDRAMFAYAVVWLANTASLFLPISNLSNLLAVQALSRAEPGSGALDFAILLWPSAIVSVLVTVVVLMIIFRRQLAGAYVVAPAAPVEDRVLFWTAMGVCIALGPALLLGVDIVVAAAVGAVIITVGCLARARRFLAWSLLPWKLVLGVTILFVLVQLGHEHGLDDLVRAAAGPGEGWAALARLTGIGALAANLINNLPSYLALEPATEGSPVRLAALLLGVNSGPLMTPWASLATLLWAARCRSAGLQIDWRQFTVRGLVLVPVLLVLAVTAQWGIALIG